MPWGERNVGLAWCLLVPACTAPAYVVLTVEDPDELARMADRLTVSVGDEVAAELSLSSDQRFPLTLALSSSEPSKVVRLDAAQGERALAGGHAEVAFDPATPLTATIRLGAPCQLDAECQDDKFCNGEELCELGACSVGVAPCTFASNGCLTLECRDDVRACVVSTIEGLDDGDRCTVDLCDGGTLFHRVDPSLDPQECTFATALVAPLAAGFVCGDGRHFLHYSGDQLSVYDRYEDSSELVIDPSPSSGLRTLTSASRDCSRIAYQRQVAGGATVFVLDRDSGVEQTIARGGNARLSDDATFAVLTATSGRAVWIDLGTGVRQTLGTEDPGEVSSAVDISGDGQVVAYWVSRSPNTLALGFMDRTNNVSWELEGFDSANTPQVRLSRDGRFAVFALDGIVVYVLATRTVTRGRFGDELLRSSPSISADGRYLAYERAGDVVRFDRAPRTGDSTEQVVCGPAAQPPSGNCYQASISDDGRTVGYQQSEGAFFWHAP